MNAVVGRVIATKTPSAGLPRPYIAHGYSLRDTICKRLPRVRVGNGWTFSQYLVRALVVPCARGERDVLRDYLESIGGCSVCA